MGKIFQLKEELIILEGSNSPIYPVTSVKAVYTSNNEPLDLVIVTLDEKAANNGIATLDYRGKLVETQVPENLTPVEIRQDYITKAVKLSREGVDTYIRQVSTDALSLSNAQQQQARTNIGAASTATATTSTNGLMSKEDKERINGLIWD